MNNDNKTLADVQPGGRVRLGDFLPPLPCTHYNACGDGSEPLYTSEQMRSYARAALSAQPSPGGQGDDSDLLTGLRAAEEYLYYGDSNPIHTATVRAAINAITARQPVGEPAIWVSPGQLAAHKDRVPGDGGAYLPARLTRDGQFTKPLYAGPPAQQPAQAVDPADPWRGLYSPERMPKLDGVNLYHVAHPDLPEWPKEEDEERGIGPLITAQGFAVEVVFGEYPDDDAEEVDYCAWLASWTPEPPVGLGWRLACIQDTEDGPAAFYVRPLALTDSQAVGK